MVITKIALETFEKNFEELFIRRFSLLELLHPDGITSTSLVLGSSCPKNLFPEAQFVSEQEVELLIVAPSTEECRSEGWLDKAAKLVSRRLSNDGVCYILVPVPWRLEMIRLLSKMNLVIDLSFWHFPDWDSSQFLVPLQRGPAQFAAEKIIHATPWKRILARELFRYSSTCRIFSTFWKSSGLTVRRPSARPLFQWLSKRMHKEHSRTNAIIRQSWRGRHNATILYCFTEEDVLPSTIAKITPGKDSAASLHREAQVLEALGRGAQNAGIHVSEILLKEQNDQNSALFLSFLPGRPASDLLVSNSDLLYPVLIKIISWLERWHIGTVNVRSLELDRLEHDLLVPLARVAPLLQDAEGYRAWLVKRVQEVAGISFPFVATHNDLTMANVLVHEHDHLGVVDWETGMAEGWPLSDFYYAITDAIRIANGHNDWLEAFNACYEPNSPYISDVKCWDERLRSALEISPDMAELCFHVCWLHHASNEHQASIPGDPRPFLQIVQRLALNYSKSNENRN